MNRVTTQSTQLPQRAGLKRSAERLLGVNHGEWTLLGLFFLLYFLNAFGACIGLNAGESLFIEAYGVQNIPVIFPLTSVFTILVTLLLSYLANRFPIRRYAPAVFAALCALLGLTYFCLVTQPELAVFTAVLFIFAYSFLIITKTLLFDLSDAFYDLRQSKRLFPIYSSGTVLGLASAGLLTGRLLALVQRSVHLVPVWILFTACAALTMIGLLRLRQAAPVEASKNLAEPSHPLRDVAQAIRFQFQSLRRSRLLWSVAVVSFVTAFVVVHFDFIYMSAVKAEYGDADQVTQVFGKVRGYSTLIAFGLQFFVTGLLIRTLGSTQVLFIFPLFFTCIYGLLFIKSTFAVVLMGRLGYYITKEAIHFPAVIPLFNALSDKVKKYANALINNVVAQLGGMAAGLFLVLFVNSGMLSIRASIPVALGLLVLLLAMIVRIQKEYVRELLANIKEQSPRQLDRIEALKGLKGAEALASMREILRGDDRTMISFVIESLTSLGTSAADPEIIALLARHDDPATVHKVLKYFRGTFRSEIMEILDAGHAFHKEQTKLALLDYLASCYPDPAERETGRVGPAIGRLFEEGHACVRMKAAGILCHADSPDTREAARSYVATELGRASAAEALPLMDSLLPHASEFAIDQILSQGEKYVAEAADDIRRRFLAMVVRFPAPRALAVTLDMVTADEDCLGLVGTKLAAVHAAEECHAYADAILGLQTEGLEIRQREMIVKLLLFLRQLTPDAESYLINTLFACHRTSCLHFQIAAKLPSFSTAPDAALDSRLRVWVAREIEAMQACLLAQRTFQEEDVRFSHIFQEETARLLQARLEAILSVIRYQYADQQMGVAVGGFQSPNPKLRASAIETIESILPRKIADVLIPFLEGDLDQVVEQSGPQAEALALHRILGEWIDSDRDWLTCLALYLAGECRLQGLHQRIEQKETGSALADELRESYLQVVSA